ncbi:DinB family protein [Mycobacterium sp. Y57]|uniref:DinB family protein n=1 Tax=Mycolicibacterium xanthum TaxID=2796469 RepID=UPI001C864D6B|nr:DinB family protein [Mycolicibacterium xanthum]MBX7432271.1 DinB family protein [Mycolicibacterium xanthum]
MTDELAFHLADQLDHHWRRQLRPRLDGLTDDEYFWAPVPDCWTLHTDGSIDYEFPEPDPAPLTTISWRPAHITVGVLAVRGHGYFGGPPADYRTWPYAPDADTALQQLDSAYRVWIEGVQRLDDRQLRRPLGPAEGPYADRLMVDLVLHIHREVIHHGAEIALLRDLFAHTQPEES